MIIMISVFIRFADVLPYDENRVQVSPTKDNKTGYVNASHVTVSLQLHYMGIKS